MFTKKARELANPYWEGSFKHPFITQLQEGKLSEDAFRYYLIQDRYYLEHFSKIHLLIAEKTNNLELKKLLVDSATHLAEGEISIRETFFKELGITDEEIKTTPIAPTAYHYVSHMYRQLVDGTVNSAAAGLLPCSWLYQQIGTRLIAAGSPVDIYQRWIETYSGEDFAEEVKEQCGLFDRLYQDSGTEEQEKMIEAFYISSQMEYLFWEMALVHEIWPTGIVVNG
ncbi:thiaminase II [Vagococcus sp.]|uniref:thiaminase II n=1 Tax=Vagococcus sp. TaxID=1933889 RepID=UPI003F9C2907